MYIENYYPILLFYAFISYIKKTYLHKWRFHLHLHLIVVHSGIIFVFSKTGTPTLVQKGQEPWCPSPPPLTLTLIPVHNKELLVHIT